MFQNEILVPVIPDYTRGHVIKLLDQIPLGVARITHTIICGDHDIKLIMEADTMDILTVCLSDFMMRASWLKSVGTIVSRRINW